MLLELTNLHISFPSPKGLVPAVRGVSFSLGCEKLGIVGESGSGKSISSRAILRLLPPQAQIQADKISFKGQELQNLSSKEMQKIRGNEISMVMQDPKYSLNPVMSVGKQIAEAYRIHKPVSKAEAYRKTIEMLEAVNIRQPEQVYKLFPHEVSGGMGQRIMIAMMLIPEPSLLIADEPTSALDVSVQLEILRILDNLVTDRGMGLIFISHDLELVSSFCDRIVIMYGGQVMETIDADKLYQSTHPYTQGLLACLPTIKHCGSHLPTLKRDSSWLNLQGESK